MKANTQAILYEMLVDRGISLNESELNIQDSENAVISDKIVIIDYSNGKLGVNHVKQIETYIEEYQIKNIIVIYKGAITSFAKTQIDVLNKNANNIETFEESEFQFNITKHYLVPKHELITNRDKKKELMKCLNVKESQMPIILQTDPVAKYFGANPGDLFCIERNDENTIKTLYYRIVV